MRDYASTNKADREYYWKHHHSILEKNLEINNCLKSWKHFEINLPFLKSVKRSFYRKMLFYSKYAYYTWEKSEKNCHFLQNSYSPKFGENGQLEKQLFSFEIYFKISEKMTIFFEKFSQFSHYFRRRCCVFRKMCF